MITFATYHTDLSESAVEQILTIFPIFRELNWAGYLSNSQKYMEIMFQSTRLHHPSCPCVVLTDKTTSFSLSPDIAVCRYSLDSSQPAYMRLLAQMKYLKEADGSSHIIFLDYDMLIQANLLFLFEQGFDIALTYRKHYMGKRHPCPINGGLMFIHAKRISRALSFLTKVLAIYDQYYAKYRAWGGAQRSLSDAVGNEAIFNRDSDLLTIEGSQVLILSDEIYNYSIETTSHMVDYLPNKKVLHFKGPRKGNMQTYWNEYMRPRDTDE